MTHSYSAASAFTGLALIGRGARVPSSLGSVPATLSPTGVNLATNHGGRNETAARSPVKTWRRHRHDLEKTTGAPDHDLGSLTRPAHAAVVPGLRSPTAALSSIVHNQHQSTDGTERGARSWGSCRQYPAVADHLQDWPRKRAGMVTSNCSRTRGGLRARPAFHHFDFRTQPTWQGIADVLPRHFINSVASCAPNQAREAEHEVPNFKSIWCPNVR